MGIISKQPNGLYCRISTIVDAPTFYNATIDELKDYLEATGQLQPLTVEQWIENYGQSFEYAIRAIKPINWTQEEIDEWLVKVNDSNFRKTNIIL